MANSLQWRGNIYWARGDTDRARSCYGQPAKIYRKLRCRPGRHRSKRWQNGNYKNNSHNSISSPEVTKEVTEATRVCRYILPFKVDRDDLSDRLRYHLGPCHWLDAVSPPLEQRLEELLQRIRNLSDEDEVYRNHDQQRLVDCHTITVELIAKQMRSSFVKPAKMLELLKGTGTNTGLKEKVNREGAGQKLAVAR